MKEKGKLFAAVLLFVIAGMTAVNAETIETASRSDFDDLQTLWSEAYSNNTYETYQEKLCQTAKSLIPDELCPYMLAEALFYRYYASSFIDMPENEALDDSLSAIIEYCSTIEDKLPVLRTIFELFRSVQKTAPFRNLSAAVFFDENAIERPVEEDMLPDASSGRLLMLRTLAEVEAMSQRFRKATESRGGDVLLKFSKEAYLSVMEKPAMVYVITHEPVYAELNDVLNRSSADVDANSFGETADAFYTFENLVAGCEEIASVKGIPLSDVLSEEAWTAIMLYHTDPFAVLSLNASALNRLNTELDFIAQNALMYVQRINELPEKREGSL